MFVVAGGEQLLVQCPIQEQRCFIAEIKAQNQEASHGRIVGFVPASRFGGFILA